MNSVSGQGTTIPHANQKKKFWRILEMTLDLQSETLDLNPSSVTHLLFEQIPSTLGIP